MLTRSRLALVIAMDTACSAGACRVKPTWVKLTWHQRHGRISPAPHTFTEAIYNRDPEELLNQEREGGIIRILMKIIFRCIRDDKSLMSHNLLRYLVFRDKKTKDLIQNSIGIKLKPEDESIKTQSILNIIIGKDKITTKKYEAVKSM